MMNTNVIVKNAIFRTFLSDDITTVAFSGIKLENPNRKITTFLRAKYGTCASRLTAASAITMGRFRTRLMKLTRQIVIWRHTTSRNRITRGQSQQKLLYRPTLTGERKLFGRVKKERKLYKYIGYSRFITSFFIQVKIDFQSGRLISSPPPYTRYLSHRISSIHESRSDQRESKSNSNRKNHVVVPVVSPRGTR